ncbi:MAG: 2-keto-4-pentenoate hydratase [Granulosicoccus sp.]
MRSPEHAAIVIQQCWQNGETIPALPQDIRPTTPEDGYAIQAELARLRSEPVVGWKIAATAEKGRNHIRVDRPLAGPLYPSIVFEDGAIISLASNRMLVAEAEIVLSLKSNLAPLERPRSEQEVAEAVGTMHAGLEFPDSRFEDFTTVGTACLIADNACARHFILGKAVTPPTDLAELATTPTTLLINDQQVTSGHGSDALGGSLTALTWLVNTVNELGITLWAGEFVTTGVTGAPSPIHPGDRFEARIGTIASVRATASD